MIYYLRKEFTQAFGTSNDRGVRPTRKVGNRHGSVEIDMNHNGEFL